MLCEPTRRDRDGESSGNRSLGSGSARASGTFVSKPRGCPDPRLEFSLYVLSGSRRTRRAHFAGRPRYDTTTCGGQKSGKYTNRTLLFIDCSAQQAWGQGVELLEMPNLSRLVGSCWASRRRSVTRLKVSNRYSGDGGTCMSPVTKVFRVSRSATPTQIDRWIPSEAGSIAADEDKIING